MNVNDLFRDFQARGIEAIRELRDNDPAAFIQIISEICLEELDQELQRMRGGDAD